MSTSNALDLTNQEKPFQWRMPIEPSDYPDRRPSLTEEERRDIAYLLSLLFRPSVTNGQSVLGMVKRYVESADR